MPNSSNLKDVARAAGVSISTASRALSGNPLIAPGTRRRVEEIARQLNYRPNAAARNLRTAKTSTIGLCIPSLENPFFAQMAAAVQEKAWSRNLATIITSYSEDPKLLERSINSLILQNVDGMIVVPHSDAAPQLQAALDADISVVQIDRAADHINLPLVSSDPVPGMQAAIADLAQHGHKRIGYIAGPLNLSTGKSRYAAFQAACAEHQISTFLYEGGFSVEGAGLGAQELIAKDITAIVAGDSVMTLGALFYCHHARIRIGSELAFVGFDDLLFMRTQAVPLSAIDQNVKTMSHKAVEILQSCITGEHIPQENLCTYLPSSYLRRASTTSDAQPGVLTERSDHLQSSWPNEMVAATEYSKPQDAIFPYYQGEL